MKSPAVVLLLCALPLVRSASTGFEASGPDVTYTGTLKEDSAALAFEKTAFTSTWNHPKDAAGKVSLVTMKFGTCEIKGTVIATSDDAFVLMAGRQQQYNFPVTIKGTQSDVTISGSPTGNSPSSADRTSPCMPFAENAKRHVVDVSITLGQELPDLTATFAGASFYDPNNKDASSAGAGGWTIALCIVGAIAVVLSIGAAVGVALWCRKRGAKKSGGTRDVEGGPAGGGDNQQGPKTEANTRSQEKDGPSKSKSKAAKKKTSTVDTPQKANAATSETRARNNDPAELPVDRTQPDVLASELKPTKFPLNEKQKLINAGHTVGKDAYPTMADVVSDWDTEEDGDGKGKKAKATKKKGA